MHTLQVISGSLAALLLLAHSMLAQTQKARPPDPSTSVSGTPQPAIWREPTDIKTRDLFYGPGGKNLQPLSPDQIADAFRAAGYRPDQVSAYARKVSERIAELTKL